MLSNKQGLGRGKGWGRNITVFVQYRVLQRPIKRTNDFVPFFFCYFYRRFFSFKATQKCSQNEISNGKKRTYIEMSSNVLHMHLHFVSADFSIRFGSEWIGVPSLKVVHVFLRQIKLLALFSFCRLYFAPDPDSHKFINDKVR